MPQTSRTATDRSRCVDHVVIVTSPKAGTGAGREQLPVLTEMLRNAGIESTVTSSIPELQSCLQREPTSEDNPFRFVVVAAGGDGTLSLVADSIPASVPILPMPFGTENLLARFFGYQPTARCMLDAITRGNSYRMDAGRGNGKLFLVMASCGFDAEVVRGLHLKRQGHINRFSYARPIWRALRRYAFPEITVTTNSTAETFGWAMVFNLPRYGGGLAIEPDAIGTDGKLDLIAFRKRSIASGLKYFGGVVTSRHTGFADVVRRRIETISLHSDQRVPYQLDGDYAGRLPLKIETLPRRIHLLLPALPATT